MRRRWLAILSLAILVACTSRGDDAAKKDSPARAPKLCSIDPAEGEGAIMAAIQGCANGSIVQFPPNRTYHQSNRILIQDRQDLTIDGNGSTFINSAHSDREAANGNWVVLRGRNITLRNMTSIGSFDLEPPRSLAKYPAGVGWENHSAYAFYGTDGGGVNDAKGLHVWGDGVMMGFDGMLDATVPMAQWSISRNLVFDNLYIEKVARVCFAPTEAINVRIQNSTCKDAWTWGLDAEADANGDGTVTLPINGLHVVGNTFEGYNFGGIAVPVGGNVGNVREIEIRGNRLLSGPDGPCQPSILVGAYPDNLANRFQQIVVEGNEIRSLTRAIVYYHVDGGAVRDNVVHAISLGGGGVGGGDVQCGEPRQVIVEDSPGVAVERNTVHPPPGG